MAAKTRFGLEGYGVRRASSFAGKTTAVVVVVGAPSTFPDTADELIDAQLGGATVRAATLVMFDFKSGPKHIWGGFGDLVIQGQTYQGIGNLGALSSVGSGPGGAVEEITCSVFGDDTLLADIEGDAEESAGRDITVYLQFFDTRKTDERGVWVDWKPIGAPMAIFVGRMGPMTIKRQSPQGEGGATRIVSIPAQNIMVNRGRPAFQFFTDRDQKSRSPTDNAFLRVSQYSEGTVRWPIF